MVGLNDTKATIEKWNEKAKKLTDDDVMEISVALSKASKAYRKSGKKRMTVDERCKRVIEAFSKYGGRMTVSKVRVVAGVNHASSVVSRLRANGYDLKLVHEFHGYSDVSFYVLGRRGET